MLTFTVTQLTLDSSLSSLFLVDFLDLFCALSQTSPPECSPSPLGVGAAAKTVQGAHI